MDHRTHTVLKVRQAKVFKWKESALTLEATKTDFPQTVESWPNFKARLDVNVHKFSTPEDSNNKKIQVKLASTGHWRN